MTQSLNSKIDFEQVTSQLVHDLASPLAVMQLNLANIKNMLPKENIQMMESALDQIRDITFNALDKSNTQVSLSLTVLAEKIMTEKLYIWKDNPCCMELKAPELRGGDQILACPSDIYRMLSNLLNNAYESLDQRRNITLQIREEKNHILLSVIDSGCGISKEKINSVLNGETLKKNGHGIGLSSAFRYMQSINGYLMLESEENVGSKVTLIFQRCLT